MTNYRHGADLERAVKKLFEANGYYVIKSGGSKGPADLVALKRGETVLIQCKLDGYLRPSERQAFVSLAVALGALPLVAGWRKEGRAARTVRLRRVVDLWPGMTMDDWPEWSPDWALEET